MIRWWNVGRYEAECAAFDAEHPLSRQVWESLQRMGMRWSWFADFAIVPRDSLLLRMPEPDPWEEFAHRVYGRQVPYPLAFSPAFIIDV